MDRFQEMYVYCQVVEQGSFVKAADALDMSGPSVTRYINELESRLGVRLLQRTTRRQSLTEEGQVFYERCKVLLQAADEAEAEARSSLSKAAGRLRINVPVSFGLTHLAPLWPEFAKLHPGVSLDVTLSDRFVDLIEEGYDLAVRIGRLGNSTLVSRLLTSTRMMLCASPAYLRERGQPKTLADLGAHTVVAYSLLSTADTWHLESEDGPAAVTVRPVMHSNSGDTCVEAAIKGMGIVLQPSFLVEEALRAGALVQVLPAYKGPEYGIYAVYPTRSHLPLKVRALVDFLGARFDGAAPAQ